MAGRLDVVLTYWAHAGVEACRRGPGRRRRSISGGETAGLAPVRQSGGEALVPVVQAADLGQLDHVAGLRRHHRARRGRVLAERQMCA